MTQHPKAEAARKAVERMEQERVMVHGIEVKPGQVWDFEGHSGDYPPSRVVSVDHAQRVIRVVDECAAPEPDEWGMESFARSHPRLLVAASVDAAPAAEPTRWTDAEWAEEQVALARRQADAARAEARELRAERDRVAADRDKLRADLDHLHVGTLDHERMAGLRAEHAQLRTDLEHAQAALSSTRAALEAARAAVHTPSPGGSDGPWSPPVLTLAEARRLLDEGREVSKEVKRRLDRMERPPGGSDPGTKNRGVL